MHVFFNLKKAPEILQLKLTGALRNYKSRECMRSLFIYERGLIMTLVSDRIELHR